MSVWNKCLCVVVAALLLAGCAGGVRVRKGDTLYSLARKNDIPVRAMIEVNNLKPPYTIHPGQYLRLPTNKTHRVRRSETLYSIAKRYDMSVSSLARLNRLSAPYTIHPGQVLKISSWQEAGVAATQASVKASGVPKPLKRPNAFKGEAKIPKSQAKKKFAWPVKGKVISDFGGGQAMGGNDGINIAGKLGTPIKAADNGTVVYAGNELKGYGNLVLVRHKDGWITAYAHNNKLAVKKGQAVVKGQKIAEMGKTGGVKTPQLHFEVRYKAKVVNPKKYLAGQ